MLCIVKKKSQTSLIPNFKDDMPTKPHPIPVAAKLHTMAKTEIIILYPFVMQSPPHTNFDLSIIIAGSKELVK